MSVAELCAELNERYKKKGSKMPAERHIQQLMDKVRTKEEAELAANAIARFHHERVSFFSKPHHSAAANQPPLDGTTSDRGGGRPPLSTCHSCIRYTVHHYPRVIRVFDAPSTTVHVSFAYSLLEVLKEARSIYH